MFFLFLQFLQATRRAIEESGREARWEFSVQVLKSCSDLLVKSDLIISFINADTIIIIIII
jgi:hypothetical protein